jgi:hypothetical protein
VGLAGRKIAQDPGVGTEAAVLRCPAGFGGSQNETAPGETVQALQTGREAALVCCSADSGLSRIEGAPGGAVGELRAEQGAALGAEWKVALIRCCADSGR